MQFKVFSPFTGFSKSINTSQNLYGHFLYISERAEITLTKSKEFCTNIIKYRKQKVQIMLFWEQYKQYSTIWVI